ncbi:MAG: hypothetical protein ABIH00_06135 [Armatimonadota bacterium]
MHKFKERQVKTMHKFRVILLAILIPLFIASVIFFYIYNSPQNQISRKIKDVVKEEGVLLEEVKKLTLEDAERFIYESRQIKNLIMSEDFSINNIDLAGISKINKKILGELELFKDKIRTCRDKLGVILLEPEQNLEKFQDLISRCNYSLDLLTYFAVNYEQAISINEVIVEDFEKFALSESQEYILKPMDRYFQQAAYFKNQFIKNYNYTVSLMDNIKKPEEARAMTKPVEENIKTLLDAIIAQNNKIIANINQDVNNDSIKDLIVLVQGEDGYYTRIYDFKNGKYEQIWEHKIEGTPPGGLYVRHLSLTPEIVLNPTGPVFKYNGTTFEESYK